MGFRTRSAYVAVRAEEHVIQIELTLASTREVRARHCRPERTGSYASSDICSRSTLSVMSSMALMNIL